MGCPMIGGESDVGGGGGTLEGGDNGGLGINGREWIEKGIILKLVKVIQIMSSISGQDSYSSAFPNDLNPPRISSCIRCISLCKVVCHAKRVSSVVDREEKKAFGSFGSLVDEES
ncbi:hypothetical protein Tco_0855402 [Tanacetum coccineum]